MDGEGPQLVAKGRAAACVCSWLPAGAALYWATPPTHQPPPVSLQTRCVCCALCALPHALGLNWRSGCWRLQQTTRCVIQTFQSSRVCLGERIEQCSLPVGCGQAAGTRTRCWQFPAPQLCGLQSSTGSSATCDTGRGQGRGPVCTCPLAGRPPARAHQLPHALPEAPSSACGTRCARYSSMYAMCQSPPPGKGDRQHGTRGVGSWQGGLHHLLMLPHHGQH